MSTPATNPLAIEIDRADLQAVRRFLTAHRDEPARPERPARPQPATGLVPVRHGIARARDRHAAPKGVA
jgi:hypothetical protein